MLSFWHGFCNRIGMTEQKKEVLGKAVKFLTNVYSEDLMAMAQIITARDDKDIDLIVVFLSCVIDYSNKLINRLTEEDNGE